LSSKAPVGIRRWWLAVPSSYDRVETQNAGDVRVDRFSSKSGTLEVRLSGATFPVTTSIRASGDGPLGRGVHGAVPLHLVFESHDVEVTAEKPLKFKVTLSVS